MSAMRCFVRTVLLLALVVAPPTVQGADPLGDEIYAVINGPNYRQAHWGILVVDAKTREVVFAENPEKLFAPASTTKLYSCAAAMALLGPDHVFTTPVHARGEIKDGILKGDLILVAQGDLTFGGRTDAKGRVAFKDSDHTYANGNDEAELTDTDPLQGLKALAKQVAAAGVRQVDGDVLMDDRLFVHNRGSGSGPDLLTPIIVNDNVVDVIVESGSSPGEPARVTMRPETGFYTMDAKVETVASTRKTNIEIRKTGPNKFSVRGQVARRAAPLIRILPVDDPAAFARALFIECLRKEGVRVDASLTTGTAASLPPKADYAQLQRLATFQSPPLHEAIKVTLKVSHNLYASTLPLLIAVKQGKRTLAEGMRIEGEFLAKQGVDIATISFGGGAGGSNADATTPRATVDLLLSLANRPEYSRYKEGLPILGIDGTLSKAVNQGSPATGKVFAKTGTLSWTDNLNDRNLLTSKALAGTMTTSSGRELVFAMFVNRVPLPKDVGTSREGKVLGHLCELIYERCPPGGKTNGKLATPAARTGGK